MLILTRKPDQSLFIGKDIKITVMEVRGSVVHIGIEAPKHIDIVRDNVRKPKKGANYEPDGNK